MPTYVFFMVLAAALLHASWNIIVKGGSNKLYETALNAMGAGLGAICFLPFIPFPPAQSWGLLAVSCAGHLAYYFSMADTYNSGELSLCYPVMRGCAPLFTALILLFYGISLPAAGWLGIILLCLGILTLAVPESGRKSQNIRSIALSMRTALLVAIYSLADGYGARLAENSISYTMWLFLINMFPILAVVMLKQPRNFAAYFRQRAKTGLFGGFCSLGSYSIAIWAMTMAPIALVAALRETSPIFGVLLAVIFLKEKVDARRLVAIALVVCGALTFRFG